MKTFILSALLVAAGIQTQAQIQNYNVGDTAPDFTVTDIHGTTHTLSQYTNAGQYVLLDFFAYWCGPCQATSPIINEFYKKYGCNSGDVAVLAVEYEGTTAQTESYEANYGGDQNYPTPAISGLNGGGAAVHSTYGPAAFPTVCLIGPDGKFVNMDIWPISNITHIESAFPAGTITPKACAVVSVPQTADIKATMQLYPVPAREEVTILLTSPVNEQIVIKVIDLTGRTVISREDISLNGKLNFELNVSHLPAGQYIVCVDGDQGFNKKQKLIVQ